MRCMTAARQRPNRRSVRRHLNNEDRYALTTLAPIRVGRSLNCLAHELRFQSITVSAQRRPEAQGAADAKGASHIQPHNPKTSLVGALPRKGLQHAGTGKPPAANNMATWLVERSTDSGCEYAISSFSVHVLPWAEKGEIRRLILGVNG